MRQELMSFPIVSEAPGIETTARMTTQLEQLRSLVLLVKRLFQERESHIEEMGHLITSQHSAIMKLSKDARNVSEGDKSRENHSRAQAILDSDRASRRELRPRPP
jgi:hypothetical protein